MNRLVELSPENLTATVQAGMTRLALVRAVGEHGLFFPVDPGADATLGGMAATNAAGTTTVRYGKMRANVLALEAVLADGSVIRTGTRARKTSAGYDLTGLLVGSEGTLARDHRVDGATAADRRARCRAADLASRHRGRVPHGGGRRGCRRRRDARSSCWMRGWSRRSTPIPGHRFPRPVPFVEATGTRGVEGDLELVEEIAEARVRSRSSSSEMRTPGPAVEGAHDMAHAATALGPGQKERATDVCVPLTELAGAVRFARSELDRLGLQAGIAGHAGDGNVHVSIHADPGDADEMRASDELVRHIVEDALARGGTCTGEHGIGQGKIGALQQEHGDLIALMQGIKRVFDPLGIMNPGKVLPASALRRAKPCRPITAP